MMFVIEAKQDPYKWISGVFLNENDAVAFLESIPSRLYGLQKLYSIPFSEYPVYMIESDESRFLTRDEAIQAVHRIQRKEDYEWVYFNIYRFSKDYAPDEPGTDFMGSIEHYHIDNWSLDRLQSSEKPHFRQVFPDASSG